MTRHVDVPCAWSLPSASSILPSSVMTVRPRETTWPVTCITPESMDIGRTNLAGSRVTDGFPRMKRRLGGKRHDGVEHRHDPAAWDGIRQIAKKRGRGCQEPGPAFLRWEQGERESFRHRWAAVLPSASSQRAQAGEPARRRSKQQRVHLGEKNHLIGAVPAGIARRAPLQPALAAACRNRFDSRLS